MLLFISISLYLVIISVIRQGSFQIRCFIIIFGDCVIADVASRTLRIHQLQPDIAADKQNRKT